MKRIAAGYRLALLGSLLLASVSVSRTQTSRAASLEDAIRRMPRAQADRSYPGMGLYPTEAREYARISRLRARAVIRQARPAKLILNQYLPPVVHQGKQGSCVGWALAYYAYTYAVSKQRKLPNEQLTNTRFEFSPAFLYNQCNGGSDTGITLDAGCRTLVKLGCSTLKEMPYNDGDYTTQPGVDALKRAANYKAPAYGYLFSRMGTADPEALKTYLVEIQQPFVIGIPVFNDFPKGSQEPDYVYNLSVEPAQANLVGGHALTVIGYDDEKKAFRIVNSWGTTWGDKGFLWISEDFINQYGFSGFAFVPGGPTARTARQVSPHIRMEPPNSGKSIEGLDKLKGSAPSLK